MTHPELVRALKKKGADILRYQSAMTCDLMHMGMGVCGEAGELIDAIKKITIYEQRPDMENIIEELGDIEFFLEGIRQNLHISREECLDANIAKLQKRYHSLSYSNAHATERVDKQC